MNLTFFDRPYWWDVIFLAILLICIRTASHRGAFRALSGIAGTLCGLIVGNLYQDALAPKLEPLLQPLLESLAAKADLGAVTGLEEGSALHQILSRNDQLTQQVGELYGSLLTALAEVLARSLAPILAFLLLFAATKLALQVICLVLDLDLPILSSLNRMAGGLLGAVAGILTVLVLCWAVMRYAPMEDVGLLSQRCLLESFTGSVLGPLFTAGPAV